MQPTTPLHILQRVECELNTRSARDINTGDDKIFFLFDCARRALSPVAERSLSPEREIEVTRAVDLAALALAEARFPNERFTEESAYMRLTLEGRGKISPDVLLYQVKAAIRRLQATERVAA